MAFASSLPWSRGATLPFTFDGTHQVASTLGVSATFFETFGMSILRGRALADAEPSCASGRGCAIVVSQELGRRLVGTRSPMGITLRGDSGEIMRVVGVASDVRRASGLDGPVPVIYQSRHDRAADAQRAYVAFARFTGPTAEAARAIGASVREVLPGLSVEVQNVDQAIDEEVRVIRQIAILVGVLAVLAVGLALIGVFGVVSFSVRRRTRELGVRIALGAATRDIYKEVARGYAWPIGVGLAVGLVISIPAAMAVQRAIFGSGIVLLDRASPLVLAIAAATMLTVTVLAIATPARRAAQADPLAALRTD